MHDTLKQALPVGTTRQWGVLVADDEDAVRDVLNLGLQKAGFSVWLAANGVEALDMYRTHRERIDVALLDVTMPQLDGPRTLAALREVTPEFPCCFMSGDLGNYTEAELRAGGARAVLWKPFLLPDAAQVLLCVVELSHRKEASESADSSSRQAND